MATFVWDPAVRWPPPANILLNYDVVAPGGAVSLPGVKSMPKSWSWTVTLTAAVADQATVEVPTPGLDLATADASTAEVAVADIEAPVPDEATVDFGDGSKAVVTNVSGGEWPQGVALYLYVAAAPASDSLEALQEQTTENASAIADLDARVAANASAIAALDARVAALETPVSTTRREP